MAIDSVGVEMDGVHVLRKRKNTRLWYRQLPVQPQPIINTEESAILPDDDRINDEAWERLFAELGDETVAEDSPVNMAPESAIVEMSTLPAAPLILEIPAPSPAPSTQAKSSMMPVVAYGEDWRVVPNAAPSILLSATDLLDARTPGPVLHPGVRYRIGEVQNGIVSLYVIDPTGDEGDSGFGYCSAVDLICVDRRFAGYQNGRAFDQGTPFKSRVTRLTGSLSQATTSLLGAATNSSRPS